MPAAITLDVYLGRLQRAHQGRITLHTPSEFRRIFERIAHVCNVCGHGRDKSWRPWASDMANGVGCPGCQYQSIRQENLMSEVEYCRRLRLRHQGSIRLLDVDWRGSSHNYPHACLDCGYGADGGWWPNATNLLHRSGCPTCCHNIRSNYQLGDRTVSVRGFEPQALDWIFEHTSLQPQDVAVDGDRVNPVPTVLYTMRGRSHRYQPDIHIACLNRLVEVKSLVTAGLTDTVYFGTKPRVLWRRLKTKAQACIAAGYDFRLLVMTANGERVNLPVDWYLHSRKQIMKIIRKNRR